MVLPPSECQTKHSGAIYVRDEITQSRQSKNLICLRVRSLNSDNFLLVLLRQTERKNNIKDSQHQKFYLIVGKGATTQRKHTTVKKC